MACLGESTLFELTQGQLHGEALAAAEEHLDACAACRRTVAVVVRTATSSPQLPSFTRGLAIGRYLLIERIGAGAMGQVFAAYDPQLDRKIALKLLRPGAAGPEHRARLAREAQTLARLSHPNVVTVFDVGTWEGQLFVALELVDGGSLREWAARHRPDRRTLVELFIAAGRGLAAAHAAGVVHRDFKPDNVLVASDGRARVTDFGLAGDVEPRPRPELEVAAAEAQASGQGAEPLTATGALLGTPAYMAPDQLDGQPATPASDQFGFCVALAELLCGHRPFAGANLVALRSAMREQPPELTAPVPLPAAIEAVLRRGLAPQPDRRYPSMEALLKELERALRPPRGRVLLLGAGGLVIAAAAAVTVGAVAGQRLLAPRRHPACVLVAERQATSWSGARKHALAASFAATGFSWAGNALALITPQLESRARTWSAQRAEACEALMRAPQAASPLWAARVACLDERWAELDATLDLLAAGGAQVVERSARIVDRLAPEGACLQAEALVRYGADEAVQRTRLKARARAAESGALLEAGRFAEAAALASRPPKDGDGDGDGRAGDPLARGALLFEHARAVQELGDLDTAEKDLTEAARAGLAWRDPSLTAAAWLELGYLVGYLRGRSEAGAVWLQAADGLVTTLPAGALHERLASVHGVLESRRGQHAAAEQHFRRVESLVRERLGERHPARARALSNWANAQLYQGHVTEALQKHEQAYALLVSAYGPEHPEAFQIQSSRGAVLGEAGRFAEAAAVFAQVLAGYRKTLGPRHPRLGTVLQNLAEAHRRAGQIEAAAGAYAEAARFWEASLGPDAPDLASSLAGVAQTQLHLGATAAARAAVQRALEICGRQACEPANLAAMHYIDAELLRRKGAPASRVRAAAQRALALYKELGDFAADERATIERFLGALAPRAAAD
jgi:tetratricopeptide (TPR) repeat protein